MKTEPCPDCLAEVRLREGPEASWQESKTGLDPAPISQPKRRTEMTEEEWIKAELKMARRQAAAERALRDAIGDMFAHRLASRQERVVEPTRQTLADAILDANFLMVMTGLSAAELEEISDRADDIDGNPTVNGIPIIAEWTNPNPEGSNHD